MSLEKKYNVSHETISRMVKDGVISCSVLRHAEIYDEYIKQKTANPDRSNPEIYFLMSQDLRVSTATIDKIVYKFGKK